MHLTLQLQDIRCMLCNASTGKIIRIYRMVLDIRSQEALSIISEIRPKIRALAYYCNEDVTIPRNILNKTIVG